MKKTIFQKFLVIAIVALFAAGCGTSAGETTPTLDPMLLMTQVAGTIQAEVTQTAMAAPKATTLPIPTQPLPIPTQPLPPAPTAPTSPNAPATVPGQTPDDALWIADLESPDGTIFEPGQRFTRVFQIENSGTTIWNTEYRLVYWDGQPIMCDEADMDIALQQSVDPGNQILFSIRFTAPDPHGTYSNYFQMINDEGVAFGYPFVVEIVVGTWEAKQTQLAE